MARLISRIKRPEFASHPAFLFAQRTPFLLNHPVRRRSKISAMTRPSNQLNLVRSALVLTLAGLGAGCKEEGVRVYQVPKEQPRTQHAAAHGTPPHGANLPATPAAHVHWATLPSNWQDRPVSGVMRAAEFGIRGADGQTAELAVFALPEVRGMELEFVNMWREQIGLAATTPDDVAKIREAVTIAGNPGQLFDLAGDASDAAAGTRPRTIVALFSTEGTTWLFKLTGPDALVAAEKAPLKTFLEKVELHAEPHGDPHAGMAAAPAPPAAESGSDNLPKWTVPSEWTQTAPGMMVLARYNVAGGKAQVTVSTAGGDLLGNVNRWRGQISLPPISASQLPEVTSELAIPAGKATLVDLAGTEQRMLTVIVPQPGQTWFYKLLGETAAVAASKDAFLQFAQSTQY